MNHKAWRNDYFIKEMINNPGAFDEIEQMFQDAESLKIFKWIILYRFLTPLFGEDILWEDQQLSLLYRIFPGPVSEEEFKETYAKALVAFSSKELALFAEPYCLWHTFILKHYQHDDLFQYQEGDVVLDIGGYVGDTALFFSDLVGESGKVITFEPHPKSIEKIIKNIDKFGRKNIQLEKIALSDYAGEQRFLDAAGSGARLIDGDSGLLVKTMTLDQYALENHVKKISVIKMDVEGAETPIIKGGLETIRKMRPVLLVSIYHGGSLGYADFTPLTRLLKNSLSGYRFHLRHKNAQLYETLLVCVPEERCKAN